MYVALFCIAFFRDSHAGQVMLSKLSLSASAAAVAAAAAAAAAPAAAARLLLLRFPVCEFGNFQLMLMLVATRASLAHG